MLTYLVEGMQVHRLYHVDKGQMSQLVEKSFFLLSTLKIRKSSTFWLINNIILVEGTIIFQLLNQN